MCVRSCYRQQSPFPAFHSQPPPTLCLTPFSRQTPSTLFFFFLIQGKARHQDPVILTHVLTPPGGARGREST